MLEASDYDAVDLVSPFIGAIVDTCCRLFKSGEITNIFTKYVDVMNSTRCPKKT